MRKKRRAPIVSVAILFAATWAAAADDVDLEVRGNERIDGTLRPADERETFLIDAPRGAKITASVAGRGDGAPLPQLDLLDGSGAVVALATATSKGAKFTALATTTSDLFGLRVAGDGANDGDYRLTLKVAPQTSWTEKAGAALDAGQETTFAFAAPAGASADVSLAPAAKSAFAPRIEDVEGPDGFFAAVDGAGATPKLHKVRGIALGTTGEYAVRFRNVGAAAGAWTISVKIKAPHVARTNVDVRDGSLTGSFGGNSQVYGRIVDDQGAPVDPGSLGGGLTGSSILVPPNALTTPTVIALEVSDEFFIDDANHAAGIAVALSPSGTTFQTPVTVTVPFDPQSFDDPKSEIAVYVEDGATGAIEPVDPSKLVVDENADTVSFPTSHFSRFQGASPRARPFKGSFVQIEIGGGPSAGFGGGVLMGLHKLTGFKGPRTGNGFSRGFDRRFISYGGGAVSVSASPPTEFGVVSVVDDENVALASPTDGTLGLVRGRANDVFIAPPAPGSTNSSLFLRMADGAPTFANVAGAWHAFVYEFEADVVGGGNVLAAAGERAELSFGVDGSVVASSADTRIASSAGGGAWATSERKHPPQKGLFAPTKDGLVHLRMNLGVSTLAGAVDLVPVMRGDVLVGIAGGTTQDAQTTTAAMARLYVLVRASKASPSLLVGRVLFGNFAIAPIDRPGAGQDLQWLANNLVETRAEASTVDVTGVRETLDHDASGAPEASSADAARSDPYSVLSDGEYRESDLNVFGAVVPHAQFYFTTRFGPQLLGIGFGVVGRAGP